MLRPKNIIQSCTSAPAASYVPETFALVSWNIYKINHKNPQAFNAFIHKLHRTCAVKFFCLQEAKHTDQNEFPLPGFCLHFAANLQLKHHAYGVMTASNITTHHTQQLLSKKTEFLLKTHKSSLASHYYFADETPLIIINVHAINFKNSRIYAEEIQQIYDYLADFPNAPVIIAGDFNCWNKRRNALIQAFCQSLDMKLARAHSEFVGI
ncbi:endonuclease/exonuclease/phosphatase family protein [Facilibium subflavum]|uniref:endonuclease/exonuclease/phosphatase family protein n=1 Tax=Facilibium subflavum TaxID=2219058 RepID=UPI000E64FFD5|nr:endonuclease/exonuclease/phosphatase family protein [Facilibium subflavum]